MGGRVLEHEGKTIYNEGIAHGEERTMNAAIDFMKSSGLSDEQISLFMNSFSQSRNNEL